MVMVTGLEKFRAYFQDFSADYVIIGGVAYGLAMDSLEAGFRGTKDYDIVVVSEELSLSRGFGRRLKQFIRDGGYTASSRNSTDKPTFFRFLGPKDGTFPEKLEIATKKPFDDHYCPVKI